MLMNSKQCNLPPVDLSTYRRLANYAKVVGKPLESVIHKALNRWMDDFGDTVLESYQEMAARKAKRAPKVKAVLKEVIVMRSPDPDSTLPILPLVAEAGG